WQGRIGSSTNRFRSSFSPWTNRRVLEAMLTTHWKERDHQMLSRLLLRALHPDLSRVDVARGEPAGPSCWDVVRGMPRRLRYFAGRLSARRGWARAGGGGLSARRGRARAAESDPAIYRHLVPQWEEIVANVLRPDAVPVLTAPSTPV